MTGLRAFLRAHDTAVFRQVRRGGFLLGSHYQLPKAEPPGHRSASACPEHPGGRDAVIGCRPSPLNCQLNWDTDVAVVPAAQELATWAETNHRWSVSGQLANGQVSSMNSGQTRGDLTLMACAAAGQHRRRWGPCDFG